MKPKFSVKRDKYLKQCVSRQCFGFVQAFSHIGLSPQWALTHGFGLAGVLAPLVSFQQRCVWNVMLSLTCRTMTALLTRERVASALIFRHLVLIYLFVLLFRYLGYGALTKQPVLVLR